MPSATTRPDWTLSDAVSDAITRMAAVIGLLGIALIHVLQSPEAFEETLYLGLLFVGAVAASVVLAAALTRTNDQRVWEAAGGLAALILLGYVLSRLSGLPAATDDMGNWTEPLGLASLVVESLLVCLTAGALATRQHPSGTPAVVARSITIRGRRATGTRPGTAR